MTVVHAVPGLEAPVEVLANGMQLTSFCFGEERGPLSLTPGTYAIDVDLLGNTILSTNVNLGSGDDVTVVAHLNELRDPTLTAFTNDNSPLALPGSRVVFHHTADAPALDVVLTKSGTPPVTLSNIVGGQQVTTAIGPGVYQLEVVLAGTLTNLFGPLNITLQNGYRYNVFAIGEALTPSFDLLVLRDGLAAHIRSVQALRLPGINPRLELNGIPLFNYATNQQGPVAVAPGTYNLTVTGFDGLVTLVSEQVTLEAGDDRSLFAYLGMNNLFELADFDNDVSAPDLIGNTRVTIRHTASGPPIDVRLEQNGSLVKSILGIANGKQVEFEVPAGVYDVTLMQSGTTRTLPGPAAITLLARKNTVLTAVGVPGKTFNVFVNVIDLSAEQVPFDLQARPFGTSCGPILTAAENCFRFGETLAFTAAGGMAGETALFIAGSNNPNPVDGSGFGAPGCFIYFNALFEQELALFDGSGEATVTFEVPLMLALSFNQAVVQAFTTGDNALGFVASNGVLVTKQP